MPKAVSTVRIVGYGMSLGSTERQHVLTKYFWTQSNIHEGFWKSPKSWDRQFFFAIFSTSPSNTKPCIGTNHQPFSIGSNFFEPHVVTITATTGHHGSFFTCKMSRVTWSCGHIIGGTCVQDSLGKAKTLSNRADARGFDQVLEIGRATDEGVIRYDWQTTKNTIFPSTNLLNNFGA